MDYSGQQFEHYQLIAKLGQGGMATVYKAYDTRLERDVAIKVVRKESIPPEHLERILKRFEREAKALAKFIHPNIVPVHDYGEYQGAPFLVMAYLPGGTLKERIGKPVPVQTALRYVIPIASALSYAHQRGVIHRDVKPSNILITDDGTVMLSDFGIAQVLEEATTQLTATGMGVGTPEYMAPEQWQGQATAASDQYALGVVLYELLTGQKPYSAETPLAVALKVMSEPLPRPSELVPEIQETVEKVLYKALARDPQDRYESMEAFKSALEDVIPKPGGVPAEEKTETINSATGETLGESSATPSLSASEIEQTDIQSDQLMEPHYELELEGETFDALDSTPNSETEIPDEILDDNLEVVENYSVDTTSQQLSEPNSSKSNKKIILVVIGVLVGALIITIICIIVYIYSASQQRAKEQALITAARRTSTAEVKATETAQAQVEATATAAAQATMDSVAEILSLAELGFGEFRFGLGGVDDACMVINPTDQISQKDIFMEEEIYISAKFEDQLSRWSVDIALRDEDGNLLFEREDWELNNEENNCFWWPIYLDPHTEPGWYVAEVSILDIVVLSQEFEVTPYDISSIERPTRDPFGNFTFGRDYIETETCEVAYQAEIFQLEEIENDPWFYFATPYQMDEIGRSFYYSVYDTDLNLIYDGDRTTEDVYDLCLWQGFSLEDEPAGEYHLVFELDNGEEIVFDFEIR